MRYIGRCMMSSSLSGITFTTFLSSTWFPRTALEGFLTERGLSSLLRRVQSTEGVNPPENTTLNSLSGVTV